MSRRKLGSGRPAESSAVPSLMELVSMKASEGCMKASNESMKKSNGMHLEHLNGPDSMGDGFELVYLQCFAIFFI